MAIDDGVRIDQLDPTAIPSFDHEFPAMKDGLTVKLKVDQVRSKIAEQNLSDLPDTKKARENLKINQPFGTKAEAEAYAPAEIPEFILTTGGSTAGEFGAPVLFVKTAGEPLDLPAPAKIKLPGDNWYRWAGREFPIELGAKGDGITDNTTFFDDFSLVMSSFKGRIVADKGVFKTSKTLKMPKGFHLEGAGAEKTVFDFTAVTSMAGATGLMHCVQDEYLTVLPDLAANITLRTELNLLDAAEVEEGLWMCLYNPTDGSWINSRTSYRDGEWLQVARKDPASGLIIPTEPLWHLYNAVDMDVYAHRGPQIIARDFSILGPYLEAACFHVDVTVHPIVENVETWGTHYAGISLQRAIEPYVNCRLKQKWDDGTVGNEYGLILSIVHGGEVHGEYHAHRHGFAQGNVPTICCVPNRKTRVFANTSGPDGAASLDFGHGCSEGLEMHGGRHSGIVLGGARHRFYGGSSVKAEGHGNTTTPGNVMSGSEFRGGEFYFYGIEWRSQGNASSVSVAPIQITLTNSVKEAPVFIFNGGSYLNENGNVYFLRCYLNNCPVEPSLIVKNPYIVDKLSTLAYFARLDLTAGNGNWKEVEITGVSGLAAATQRLNATAGITATKWKFDPQAGEANVAGNTGASSVTQNIIFPHSYPAGAIPFCTVTAASSTTGGKRSTANLSGASASGINVEVATADGANFANTNTGKVRWRADFF